MDFSEQIIECDELRKTICKRAEEILRLAIVEAPNSFRVSNRFKQFSDYTHLESFHIRNGVIHFKHCWYNETAMNLYDEFIPVKWFDMTDEELVTLFHKLEENNRKIVQQKELEEKEKRRQEYLKLKEEFDKE